MSPIPTSFRVPEPGWLAASLASFARTSRVAASPVSLLVATLSLAGLQLNAVPVSVAQSSSQPVSEGLALRELFFEAGAAGSTAQDYFAARGRDYSFLIRPGSLELSLRAWLPDTNSPALSRRALSLSHPFETAQVQMRFVGAETNAALEGHEEMPGKVNYLTGNDSAQWRTGVSTYQKVRVKNLYPGVDLIYYGNHQKLEYDFNLAPGADPAVIAMRFVGVNRVRVDTSGDLVLAVNGRELRHAKPLLYQSDGLKRVEVNGSYRLIAPGTVGFTVGPYNPRLPLVIDPVLVYSTYFGGNSIDLGLAVKVDGAGNVYVAGQTLSTQFPFSIPSGGMQPNFGGGSYNGDAFVAKFDNTGRKLVYFTYLGGNGEDGGLDLAVDALGHAYIAGFTLSPNFPTKNAIYPNISGNAEPNLGLYNSDGFVAELNTNGSGLVYATYLGGTNSDYADAIAIDSSGNAYVTGLVSSDNFPVKNALRNVFAGGVYDGFVAKIAPGGSSIVYSTYLGGGGLDEPQGIAADDNGYAYITGYTASRDFPITTNAFQRLFNNTTNYSTDIDGFFTKLSPRGALVYSTFLGGGFNDYAYRIRTDQSGSVYICGSSESLDFPYTVTNVPGLQRPYSSPTNVVISYDAFLTKFDSQGALVYSTIFGGTSTDTALDLAVDSLGNAFLVGGTYSVNFPVTNVFAGSRSSNAGGADVFVTAINSNATAVYYSAYMGGGADDWGYGIAADAESSAYIVGKTTSGNFPTLSSLQSGLDGSSDSFLAKIRLADPVLNLATTGTGLLLSWPVTAPNYVLESAPSLTSPINWTRVAQTPVLSNGAYTVTVPATNGSALFRLRHP